MVHVINKKRNCIQLLLINHIFLCYTIIPFFQMRKEDFVEFICSSSTANTTNWRTPIGAKERVGGHRIFI